MLTTDTIPQRNLIEHSCPRMTVEIGMYPHTLTCMSLLLLVASQRMFIHKLKKQVKEYFVGFVVLLIETSPLEGTLRRGISERIYECGKRK